MPFIFEEGEIGLLENKIYECDGIIHYYGSPAGIVRDNVAVIDAIFDKNDLNDFIENELHCSVRVTEGIYDTFFTENFPVCKTADEIIQNSDSGMVQGMTQNMSQELSKEISPASSMGMCMRIYQLTADAPDEIRFATKEQRMERGFGYPIKKEYRIVYEEPLIGTLSNDYLEKRLLDLKDKIPGDASCHPLDVSDVIELTDGENSRFLYQNRTKYEEIEFV